jgi:hypothetical protein
MKRNITDNCNGALRCRLHVKPEADEATAPPTANSVTGNKTADSGSGASG